MADEATPSVTGPAPPTPPVKPAPEDSWFWRRLLTFGNSAAAWALVGLCAFTGGDSVKDSAITAAMVMGLGHGGVYGITAFLDYKNRLKAGGRE